jgi:class 3 adenylate cyclase
MGLASFWLAQAGKLALIDIITFGHDPADDQRTKRVKSVTLLVVVGAMAITTSNLLFGVERSPIHRTLDLIALTLMGAAIIGMAITRRLEPGWWIFVPGFMIIQVLVIILIGGVEGDFATFFLIPAAAVVVLGPERSMPWFWFCFVAMLAVPLADSLLAGSSLPMNATANNPQGTVGVDSIPFSEAIPMALATFFGYYLIRTGYQQLEQAKDVIEVQKVELEEAHARSEGLLANMLPKSIAERLKVDPTATIADDFDQVTVMFADIVGFTPLAAQLSAHDTVVILNRIFTEYDGLAAHYGLEKIKTIGDAYMVAGGLPRQRTDHAEAIAWLAIDILQATRRLRQELDVDLHLRVGISSGPAVAGVIGTQKLFYDVWGDTVNTASRMESHGVQDRIQVTEPCYLLLSHMFKFRDAGVIAVRGKGSVHVYHLEGPLEPQNKPRDIVGGSDERPDG